MFETRLKEKVNTLKTMRDAVGHSVLAENVNQYSVGFYNGIETAIAFLENREAKLVLCEETAQAEEKQADIQRTVSSGCIKV